MTSEVQTTWSLRSSLVKNVLMHNYLCPAKGAGGDHVNYAAWVATPGTTARQEVCWHFLNVSDPVVEVAMVDRGMLREDLW